ncbi:MAG: STAS domain-containing protein [Brevinematales bacterium]|nr:STAS domain-containing protein [Brevinematales bacterium]
MKYEEIDDIIVIQLPNAMNISESKDFSNLMEFLIQKGFSKFVIDFSKTGFISSAFLSIIVSNKKRLFETNGNIVLANISQNVEKILEITELISFFNIYPTVDEAINYFKTAI